MKYKAIIFDMDGVLFDTEGFYYKRRENYLKGKGISVSHIPPKFFIGGNMKQVWQKILGDKYDDWDIPKLQAGYLQYKKDHPLPYKELLFPGVRDLLIHLKNAGIRCALASSSTRNDIERALYETGLHSYFEFTLSGEEFKETKPNPEIYETAVKYLGIDKQDILVIEDSEKGIAAGHAAGITVWGIKDNHFDMNQKLAQQLIDNIPQLEKLLFDK